MGGPDTTAECLGEDRGRELMWARQGFDGVMEGGPRCGWGGRVGRHRGKTCVQ